MARMMTTEEVAACLRIAQRTVVELIGRGELAGTRIGKRRWVVSEAVVEAYVAARTSKGNVVAIAGRR